MGGDRWLNKAMRLLPMKAAAGPAVGLRDGRARASIGTMPPGTEHCTTGQPVYWQCDRTRHLRRDSSQKVPVESQKYNFCANTCLN